MPEAPDVLVVGSGPAGAAYVRLLTQARPDLDVLVVDAGPVVTEPPGANVRNTADPVRQERARLAAQGQAQAGTDAVPLDIPGTITARRGTYLVDPGNEQMPAAALASCVGGQGVLWTCAVPEPHDTERIGFIPDSEWDEAISVAARLLCRTTEAFSGSAMTTAVAGRLAELFGPLLPAGRDVGVLPVAGQVRADGTMRWTGVDMILGEAPFTLRARTRCRRLLLDGTRVTGAELADVVSGEITLVRPRVTIVAADAIHTPQLLWASGIRPGPLGRYLTEHPLTMAVVAVRDDLVPGYSAAVTPAADPVSSVICVPFADPGHPYHAQALHLDTCPPHVTGGRVPEPSPAGYLSMGWGGRKFPRAEDRLTFSRTHNDPWGMPTVSIQYALTDREHAELGQAIEHLTMAAKALGRFVPGGEPKIMPAGSSLHYQGTYRLGDDGGAESVCDSHAQVWGLDNLFLGGNGTIPTATACNPTLTSVAIAARSARRVLEVLG
ncbi:MAG: GMC oxidoreductase [Streptosporangiaceae bacterium]